MAMHLNDALTQISDNLQTAANGSPVEALENLIDLQSEIKQLLLDEETMNVYCQLIEDACYVCEELECLTDGGEMDLYTERD